MMSNELPTFWRFLPPSYEFTDEDTGELIRCPTYKEIRLALAKSAKSGISRFGWSTFPFDDLRLSETELEKLMRGVSDFKRDRAERWRKRSMRLKTEIRPGHYIIHANVPDDGLCLIAKVKDGGEYYYDKSDAQNRDSDLGEDFRHCIPVTFVREVTRPSPTEDSDLHYALLTRYRLQRVGKKGRRVLRDLLPN